MTPSATAARVAVIIVNYNAGQMLHRCLDMLAQQSFRDFRTIVVDNASTDGSADDIEACWHGVTVLRPGRNLGFAAGNNVGVREAGSCQWIALLNPDAFAEPEWLQRLVTGAEERPEYSFFGCLMRSANALDLLDGTGDVYHVSGLCWRRDHGVRAELGTMRSGEIFAPCAAAALYRRAALDEVGGFDERFFCYVEDVDLACRLQLRGHRCWYISDAVVYHVGSAITGRESDFSIYHGHRNIVWTYFKNMPGALVLLYLPYHIIMNAAGIIKYAGLGRLAVIVRAKVDALRGLPEILRERRSLQRQRVVTPWALRARMARGLKPLIQRK